MTGNLSTDYVSLNSNGSVNASATKFLLVSSATNLTDMLSDGVLGLSPNFINGEVSGGELFIKKLNDSGKISKAMFSLYFARTGTQSKLHFGGWSDTFVNAKYTIAERANKSAAELINWMNLTSPNYWQVRLTKANVYNYTANNGTNYTIWPTYPEVVLDSGSTYSYLPSADF